MREFVANPFEITSEILLKAYSAGIFPMSEGADDPGLYWVEPRERGILPLDTFHIPKRLVRTLRSDVFEIRIDHDFESVIFACAASGFGREKTWINGRIKRLYGNLFDLGYCHTVEAYRNGVLVGGLYGVRLGGTFFGESMFQRERDASKIALAHLAARLKQGGFSLLDTQFVTEHLAQFGAIEVPRRIYKKLLEQAISKPGHWECWPKDRPVPGATILQALKKGPAA